MNLAATTGDTFSYPMSMGVDFWKRRADEMASNGFCRFSHRIILFTRGTKAFYEESPRHDVLWTVAGQSQ